MQAVAVVDCRGGGVLAVQEGPGVPVSAAAAAARRAGALLRLSAADPKQQKIDAITGDRTAPAGSGQLEFQSRGAWNATYRRCGDVYVAALYKSTHGMTAAEASAISTNASRFLWRVSSGTPPRATTIGRLGSGLYSGLRRILNGQDWQVANGGYLLSPFGSVQPAIFRDAISPGDLGNSSQWCRQKEAHKNAESLQKRIESAVSRPDLLPSATATTTSAVSAADFFSSFSSTTGESGNQPIQQAQPGAAKPEFAAEQSSSSIFDQVATTSSGADNFGFEPTAFAADFQDGGDSSALPDAFGVVESPALESGKPPGEAPLFEDSAFGKALADGGAKEQSMFTDDGLGFGAAATTVNSSSDFGFGDSFFDAGTGDSRSNDNPETSSSNQNAGQFEDSYFASESTGFNANDDSAPPAEQQNAQFDNFFDSGFGAPDSTSQLNSSQQQSAPESDKSNNFGFSDGFGFSEPSAFQPEPQSQSQDPFSDPALSAPEAAPFASFDDAPDDKQAVDKGLPEHSNTNGGTGFEADAFQPATALASSGAAFGAVVPLAKKKIKLLAKLEETAFAEFDNGKIKKSCILANVSVVSKDDLEDSNQYVEADKEDDLLLTVHLPLSGVSSQGIRAATNGVSLNKRSKSEVSIRISKDALATANSSGNPLPVLKYRLATPFLFLPVALECVAKIDNFSSNVDIITRCTVNPSFKGSIGSMTVCLCVGSWLAPLKINPRAKFSSSKHEIIWKVGHLSPGSSQDLRCRLSVLASAPSDVAGALSGAVRVKIKDIESHVTYSALHYDKFHQNGQSVFSASPNEYSSTVRVMS